jgi:hypothetical protein
VFASPPDEATTQQFVRWQQDIASAYTDGPIGTVVEGDHVPTLGSPGEMFIVGDCAGLYISDGSNYDELQRTNWKPVERTEQVGKFDVDLTFPQGEPGTADPLLTSKTAGHRNVLSVEYLTGDRVRFRYRGQGPDGVSRPVHVTPGQRYHVQLSADPQVDLLAVRIGDKTVFDTLYVPDALPTLGVNTVDQSTGPRFTGQIHRRPESNALCREVRARTRRAG